MRRPSLLPHTALLGATVLAVLGAFATTVVAQVSPPATSGGSEAAGAAASVGTEADAWSYVRERIERDHAAMGLHRPGFAFWQHIFTIPDGSIAFGSAEDGRLIATFPARGDWSRNARWEDPSYAALLRGTRLETGLSQRREQVARLLENEVGLVVHNPTRGNFLLPNARRYGGFLSEWGRIYERFGVPAEIGLAQAMIESGLNPTIRSEARALGFCQWLPSNWERMKRFAPNVIEGHNQTTQAAYCAAYLTVLSTRYGSFIPALSEHHAGGTNVGRTVINGERLGGQDARERYFLGAQLARDLRTIAPQRFRDVVHGYGPRSFLYAEMVFGNGMNVGHLRETMPQERIHAMRARRAIPIAEVTRRTGLSADEVRRFNPALLRQVPARATLYLPEHIPEFGADVAFWHHPPTAEFAAVLSDFVRLDASPAAWEDRSFRSVLREFQRRFQVTETEEGGVMGAVLAYVMDEMYSSRRVDILAEFRTDPRIQRLVEEGVRERDATLGASATVR